MENSTMRTTRSPSSKTAKSQINPTLRITTWKRELNQSNRRNSHLLSRLFTSKARKTMRKRMSECLRNVGNRKQFTRSRFRPSFSKSKTTLNELAITSLIRLNLEKYKVSPPNSLYSCTLVNTINRSTPIHFRNEESET